MKPSGFFLFLSSLALALTLPNRVTAEPSPAPFADGLRPILEHYCLDCHEGDKAKANINLEHFGEESAFWGDPKLWERVLVQLQDRVMPPAKKPQLSEAERSRLAGWLNERLENPDPKKFATDPGRAMIHRLSRLEYNCTVRDLLGIDSHPADSFPPDGGGGGGFDNNAATLFIPPILMERFHATARELLAACPSERIFGPRPAGTDERVAAERDLRQFLSRAFRRPSTQGEVDRVLKLYDQARGRGESYEEAVKLGYRLALISPHFLFRIETEPVGTQRAPINDYELASRLSYFLWSSMPDAELFGLAAANKLHQPETLAAQTRRMLADPKGKTFAENFVSQWLRTKELRTSSAPARDKFPQYTPALREALYAEPVEFFHALLRDNLPILDCLDSDYTYANATLAKHYGLAGISGDEMRRVALSDHNRGGVLGMAGVLTLTSYPRRTSPVLRGKWLMEEILGTPPPPPPPLVNTQKIGNEKNKDGLSFRKRLEQHREDPKCAGCHARMDPLGFGLENFDAIGAWRTELDGELVDASGQLISGQKFTGPIELKRLLLEKKDTFVRNLCEKLLAYALGRGLEPTDWLSVRQIAHAAAQDQYRTQTLILKIVTSHQFLTRRGTTPMAALPSPIPGS